MENRELKSDEKNKNSIEVKKSKIEQDVNDEIKNRIMLALPAKHPFAKLQNELKKRGVKNIDLNALLLEIFEQVPEKWWQEKIELLTPLEFKINTALLDPNMREKISVLLNSESEKR